MDLGEIRLGGVGWTNLTQGKDQASVLVHMAMNLQVATSLEGLSSIEMAVGSWPNTVSCWEHRSLHYHFPLAPNPTDKDH
jgi:hypothetical protein